MVNHNSNAAEWLHWLRNFMQVSTSWSIWGSCSWGLGRFVLWKCQDDLSHLWTNQSSHRSNTLQNIQYTSLSLSCYVDIVRTNVHMYACIHSWFIHISIGTFIQHEHVLLCPLCLRQQQVYHKWFSTSLGMALFPEQQRRGGQTDGPRCWRYRNVQPNSDVKPKHLFTSLRLHQTCTGYLLVGKSRASRNRHKDDMEHLRVSSRHGSSPGLKK